MKTNLGLKTFQTSILLRLNDAALHDIKCKWRIEVVSVHGITAMCFMFHLIYLLIVNCKKFKYSLRQGSEAFREAP